MMNIELSEQEVELETLRITKFLRQILHEEKAVVGASGGLDSDVVARLLSKVLNPKNMKMFIILQDDMESRHLENARQLAQDLSINLHEIDLKDLPSEFIQRLADADPEQNFRSTGLLDPSRAKCSLRTPVFSTYQDRGFVIVGTSNRTEIESGFFLPFGDGIAHLKPIAHLYKTQVRQIACNIGTRPAVLNQPASAGFWKGETDLEDLAYWLYNKGPIMQQREFSAGENQEVAKIRLELTTERVDQVLYGVTGLNLKDEEIRLSTGVSLNTICLFRQLVKAASIFKRKPYNLKLDPHPSWEYRNGVKQ